MTSPRTPAAADAATVGWGGRVAERLSPLAPPTVWRGVLAFLCAVVVYWTTSGGLFFYVSGYQVAIMVGLSTALIAADPVTAGTTAVVAYLIGLLAGPASFWVEQLGNPLAGRPVESLGLIVLAGLTAAGACLLVTRRIVPARWLFWLAVALVVGNMWATVVMSDNQPTTDFVLGVTSPSIVQFLDGNVIDALKHSDDYLYVWVYDKVRGGVPYYTAFTSARPTLDPGSAAPSGVLNIREPLLYTALAAAHSAWAVVVAFLLLATGAALSPLLVQRDTTRLPLVLPAVCAIASYAVILGTSTQILYTEIWAGLLTAMAFGALAASATSARWKTWLGAAVVCALSAFLIRELAAFALLAGLWASWFAPADQRRTRLLAWGAAVVAAVVGYGAHALAAQPFLSHAAHQDVLGKGGPLFAIMGLVYNSDIWGQGMWAAVILAALGLLGAALLARGARVFALVTVVLPFAAYYVAGNGARSVTTGLPLNYWATTMLFALYACIPAAFTLLPGAAVAHTVEAVR